MADRMGTRILFNFVFLSIGAVGYMILGTPSPPLCTIR